MGQSGKVGKGVLITIVVIILSLSLGGVGYWLGTRDDAADTSTTDSTTQTSEEKKDETTATTEETADEYCSGDDKTLYSNQLIGLEFCYPAIWGSTAISAPQASESVAGSGYEIAFSAYDTVVSSITSDYQNTVGRDGRCEDPTNTPPNFAVYSTSWVKDSADSELTAAVRYPVKKDGVYLVGENVNSFFFGLCFNALIIQEGTAYPVVNVALRRPLGDVSVLDYTNNPELLLSAEERSDFLEVVESVRKPE